MDALGIIIGGGTVVVLAVLIVVGIYLIGKSSYSRTPDTTVSDPTADAECEPACDQWIRARLTSCQAAADEASARADEESAKGAAMAAGAAAVAAAAAAFALQKLVAVAGPFAIVAIIFASIAAVGAAIALGYADYKLGVYSAAENARIIKSGISARARAAVASALDIVLRKCDPTRRRECLAIPSPC